MRGGEGEEGRRPLSKFTYLATGLLLHLVSGGERSPGAPTPGPATLLRCLSLLLALCCVQFGRRGSLRWKERSEYQLDQPHHPRPITCSQCQPWPISAQHHDDVTPWRKYTDKPKFGLCHAQRANRAIFVEIRGLRSVMEQAQEHFFWLYHRGASWFSTFFC